MKIANSLGISVNADLVRDLEAANQKLTDILKTLPAPPDGWCWTFYADGRLDLCSTEENGL